tara:strand:+ start:1224 stop:5129 length:3906 start_codon:yes stop_codon:yes gene_type:complete
MLDTETTGLNVDQGDRLIEIGVVEYEGMSPTGRTFHSFINPGDRQVQAGAVQVHGITNEMLKDAPTFAEIADELLDFIGDDPIVIYNAPFDMGFLKTELEEANMACFDNEVIDCLELAKKRFPRAKNTLDVVAKKLGVDTSARDKHGAIVDSEILGQVYRRLVEQVELIGDVAQETVKVTTTGNVERKPLLRVPSVTGRHLIRAETSYTLFASALTPKTLAAECAKHGYASVALTDRWTTAGAMAFAEGCKASKIKGIVGVCLDLATTPGKPLVFYAANEAGWKNIQRLVTLRNVTNKGEGLTSAQMRDHAEGIVVTSGGVDGALAEIYKTKGYESALATAKFLSKLYHNNFAIEINRTGGGGDDRIEAVLTALAHDLELPILGSFVAKAPTGRDDLVEILSAIGSGGIYQPEFSQKEDLPDVKRIERVFLDMPEAIDNTGWLARRCDFLPKEEKPMLPRFETGENQTEEEALDAMARSGLEEHLKRVPADKHDAYWKRYDYEMGLITGQGFSGYFLIVADFISWAREQGIPVGPGRGSGAGSLVAWSLGITKLDPLEMNLLFERFINPDRVSLPDFDIDFCENRRDEVIRYVREKYGHDRVVAIGAYTTFQARGAVKDVGRIFGQSYGLMDKIAKALPDKGEITDEVVASQEIQDLLTTTESADALRMGALLHGLARNKTRHPAGIVIADRPVDEIAALELDPKDPDQAVTQYDMKPVEKAGLVKFDFLGLKTLTVIERARVNLARMGIDIDPYTVPLDDDKTLKALSQGRTMGVFQLESGGITRACREIRVDKFEDIVAIVALYRPGPMEFIPLYARRKKGLEPFGTPHPLLDDVARDTYGILVYQEQVMQAAQVLAGYTLGQADLLRRAMGKKIKEEMDAQKEIFIKGAKETNDIDRPRAEALFELIERFASYGFNRSHAAAYGLLSYITAWLANNHTAAYYAAALDGAADDTEQLVKLAQEARKRGITLLPPKIDSDARNFLPVDEKTIRWSLNAIKGIGRATVERLATAFPDGPPATIEELIEKADDRMNRSQAVSLAASGALDEVMSCDRPTIIARMKSGYDGLASEARSKRAGQIGLFDVSETGNDDQSDSRLEIPDEREALQLERDALGITLTAHPIDSYRSWMDAESVMGPTEADPLIEHMPMRVACQVDEVKVLKGKSWMNLRLSDSQTAFEVGCDESLENAHLLEKGAIVVLQISGYVTSGIRKLRVDAVERLLEDTEKDKSDPILVIEADEEFDREELRKLVAKSPEGEGRIRIIQHKNRTTTPPVVEMSENFISRVEEIRGVKSTELA